jgi:hypothetical protein
MGEGTELLYKNLGLKPVFEQMKKTCLVEWPVVMTSSTWHMSAMCTGENDFK